MPTDATAPLARMLAQLRQAVARSRIGLVGTRLDVTTGRWLDTDSHISACIDSYYEYLWKSWLLFGDADFKVANANVGFIDGPFPIDKLPMAMNEWIKGCNGQSLNLSNSGFAIVDNLSALLTYNSFNSVQTFLQNFIQTLHSSERMIAPLMIDSEKSGLLYETARSLCNVEVRMKDIMSEQTQDSRAKEIQVNCAKG